MCGAPVWWRVSDALRRGGAGSPSTRWLGAGTVHYLSSTRLTTGGTIKKSEHSIVTLPASRVLGEPAPPIRASETRRLCRWSAPRFSPALSASAAVQILSLLRQDEASTDRGRMMRHPFKAAFAQK
jgi:hypothetical protein